mgnify:CR=1 FL=1
MKQWICVFALLFLAAACASTGFPPQTAEETQKVAADQRIEISLAPGSFKGTDWELMLTEEGELHRWENTVELKSVPELIMKKATMAVKDAKIKKAEQILDSGKNLLEYPFKAERDGIKFKIVVPLEEDGVQVYRETIGEIEVPML